MMLSDKPEGERFLSICDRMKKKRGQSPKESLQSRHHLIFHKQRRVKKRANEVEWGKVNQGPIL